MKIGKIVSGGQSGVDRAALDVAAELKIPRGGWCPKGRRAEDGYIDDDYPLRETPSAEYIERTEWNVRDSDATLILCSGDPAGGTAATIDFARAMGKPYLAVEIDDANGIRCAKEWLQRHPVSTLNVAGPRESNFPGIYRKARDFLRELLTSSN